MTLVSHMRCRENANNMGPTFHTTFLGHRQLSLSHSLSPVLCVVLGTVMFGKENLGILSDQSNDGDGTGFRSLSQ
jgi:hypothetical protein